MDFDKGKTNPPSTRDLLYNQVKEQSELCDITIKHGYWEKRFHLCVLVGSPYFDNIRRNNYIERDSGVVSVTVGTPVTFEEAILFLYGKKPKMTMQNIGGLLDVAEYLIIPELKAECVKWISSKTATVGNCMTMIKLASLYNFSLPDYEEFVRGHINDLIWTEGFMDLTLESVEYLLSDPILGGFSVHDKFSFLTRWTNQRLSRKLFFKDLVKHIDFADSDKNYIINVVLNDPLVKDLDGAKEITSRLKATIPYVCCDVLIFPDKVDDNKIPCFDLTRRRWCSINIEVNDNPGFRSYKIRECRWQNGKDSPYIYIPKEDYGYRREAISVYKLDLQTNTVEESLLKVDITSGEKINYCNTRTYFVKDEIFTVSEDRAENSLEESPVSSEGIPLELLLNAGIPLHRAFLHSAMFPSRRKESFRFSTLFIGSLENEDARIISSLCIRDEISKVCANKTEVAMLSKDTEKLYLYNRIEHSFDSLSLDLEDVGPSHDFRLAPVENRFVIYDSKILVTIDRLSGPVLQKKYQASKYQFSPDKSESYSTNKYALCENMWYNYRRSRDGESVFRVTTHDKLISSLQERDTDLKECDSGIWDTLPIHETNNWDNPLGQCILQVRLTKDRLSCAKNCPHCKIQKESTRRRHFVVSSSEESDMYDDYDEYPHYDEDMYYYYDSDSDPYY